MTGATNESPHQVSLLQFCLVQLPEPPRAPSWPCSSCRIYEYSVRTMDLPCPVFITEQCINLGGDFQPLSTARTSPSSSVPVVITSASWVLRSAPVILSGSPSQTHTRGVPDNHWLCHTANHLA